MTPRDMQRPIPQSLPTGKGQDAVQALRQWQRRARQAGANAGARRAIAAIAHGAALTDHVFCRLLHSLVPTTHPLGYSFECAPNCPQWRKQGKLGIGGLWELLRPSHATHQVRPNNIGTWDLQGPKPWLFF